MCAVSIPERVLGWLKQVGVSREIVFVDVSIPERVLGWLKRENRPDRLIGFCVSIPERVLGWLKRGSSLNLSMKRWCFNP